MLRAFMGRTERDRWSGVLVDFGEEAIAQSLVRGGCLLWRIIIDRAVLEQGFDRLYGGLSCLHVDRSGCWEALLNEAEAKARVRG